MLQKLNKNVKKKLKISSIVGFTFYKNYNCGEVSKKNLNLK